MNKWKSRKFFFAVGGFLILCLMRWFDHLGDPAFVTLGSVCLGGYLGANVMQAVGLNITANFQREVKE